MKKQSFWSHDHGIVTHTSCDDNHSHNVLILLAQQSLPRFRLDHKSLCGNKKATYGEIAFL
ncbi:hypothetical protein ACPUYX_17575 [Desulfosporosinus sp. SYSU MS00001]|uniref:hypothetical protein n=1 Tax=Desulfosporosinus sp. SYSU MS00001 TaxID=3416284 RepID=UPI003CF152ED